MTIELTSIHETLSAAADKEKAAAMSAYLRDQFAFLGIPTPMRRRLCREFLKSLSESEMDWSFVFACWELPEREFQYLALDYLRKRTKLLGTEALSNIRRLIITKSWWDTVDELDGLVGGIALREPTVNELLLKWSVDENIWLRRIAIDHQLLRKEKTDTKLLEQILTNNFGQTEFFINKAIGWSLRDYSKTNPDWVRDFLKRHGSVMVPLSVREASKYL